MVKDCKVIMEFETNYYFYIIHDFVSDVKFCGALTFKIDRQIDR